MITRNKYAFVFVWIALSPAQCFADTASQQDIVKTLISLELSVAQLTQKIDEQQTRISALESENRKLKDTTLNSGVTDRPSKSPQYLPDIGVVADVTGTLSKSGEDEEGNDRLSVREVEVVIGHDIDPYSRLDSTITFSDFEEPDIEETYISLWDLPLDANIRLGRMRQKIGKASAMHRDSLSTVDEPLVVQRYLGVEGLFRTGAEASFFMPLSSDDFAQQLYIGIIEGGVGEDGLMFGETRRRPSYYVHLTNTLDLSEISSFELGGTFLSGSSDGDSGNEVSALGIDATFDYFVTPRNKLRVQAETFIQRRDPSIMENEDGESVITREDPWGCYLLVDYRLTDRFGIGARYDWVEPVNLPDSGLERNEQALSAFVTFYQSEFARWRLQYQYADLVDGIDDGRFFLQGTVAIGTHRHQIQ